MIDNKIAKRKNDRQYNELAKKDRQINGQTKKDTQ